MTHEDDKKEIARSTSRLWNEYIREDGKLKHKSTINVAFDHLFKR